MAGVTDTVFRRFIRNLGGCGLMMTEFTSADGLARMREAKARRYLTFYGNERPISAQLVRQRSRTLSEAAQVVQDLRLRPGGPEPGLPSEASREMQWRIRPAARPAADQSDFRGSSQSHNDPFTVKFRAGWNEKELVFLQLAKLAEDCGLNAVAMHARTREQGYSGQANWKWIADLKQTVKIPVIGNGDIRTPEDAAAMVAHTGCDAVMIGRTAASNPWIFRQIEQYTATGRYDLPTNQDRYDMIRMYFSMLIENDTQGAEGKMKQFASWFTHGVPGGAILRKAVYEAKQSRDHPQRRGTILRCAAERQTSGDADTGAPLRTTTWSPIPAAMSG